MNPLPPNNFFGKKDDQNPSPFTALNSRNTPGSNLFEQPSTGNPSQNTQSAAGQFTPTNGNNPFGAFNQPTNNLFGQSSNAQAMPSNLFGQSVASFPNSFVSNPSSAPSNPPTQGSFGQMSTNPFGSNPSSAPSNLPPQGSFGQMSTNPFGSNPSSAPSNLPPQGSFGQMSTNPFGSNPSSAPSNLPSQGSFGQTANVQSNPTGFPDQSNNTLFQPSVFDSTAKPPSMDISSQQALADQSSLMLSVKDKSLDLYNLTLQEITDRHSAILEANIHEFEKDAESVFERDLKLIKSKNNYLAMQKKIEEEKAKLEELSQVLDFFELKLSEIPDGPIGEGARIVEDFEAISRRFYDKVESFKDEQDEVLEMVNENYEIIENIDRKLDLMDQIRHINK